MSRKYSRRKLKKMLKESKKLAQNGCLPSDSWDECVKYKKYKDKLKVPAYYKTLDIVGHLWYNRPYQCN